MERDEGDLCSDIGQDGMGLYGLWEGRCSWAYTYSSRDLSHLAREKKMQRHRKLQQLARLRSRL